VLFQRKRGGPVISGEVRQTEKAISPGTGLPARGRIHWATGPAKTLAGSDFRPIGAGACRAVTYALSKAGETATTDKSEVTRAGRESAPAEFPPSEDPLPGRQPERISPDPRVGTWQTPTNLAREHLNADRLLARKQTTSPPANRRPQVKETYRLALRGPFRPLGQGRSPAGTRAPLSNHAIQRLGPAPPGSPNRQTKGQARRTRLASVPAGPAINTCRSEESTKGDGANGTTLGAGLGLPGDGC